MPPCRCCAAYVTRWPASAARASRRSCRSADECGRHTAAALAAHVAADTRIEREGGGLQANIDILRETVERAIDARARGALLGTPLDTLTDDQLSALDAALSGQGVQIEVVLGPTTRIGAEGHHAASVMRDLRQEIQAVVHYDVLVIRPEGLERVEQSLADAATAEWEAAP